LIISLQAVIGRVTSLAFCYQLSYILCILFIANKIDRDDLI